jgi:3-(3-hydroxy-phenyl)propionate hydroxylase
MGRRAPLDTYTEERHGFGSTRPAIKSTEFMAPPSRGFWLMREAALSLARARPEIASVANPRQTSTIAYEHSSLNLTGEGFDAGPPPGAVPDECPIQAAAGERHLSDLAGPYFTALVFAADGALEPALDDALRRLEGGDPPWRSVIVALRGEPACDARREHVVDSQGQAFRRYGAHEGSVYLLRPDGHVAAISARRGDLQAAVAHLCLP